MYSILLIDDEPILLDGLMHTVDWFGNGFDVVLTARNGFEGIEQYIDHQPDAILTDIRMRFMDGLDFIRQIRRLDPKVEILIMSAYDVFEHAQKACELGVMEYLLKPIKPDKLTQSLQALKKRLDERHSLEWRLLQAEHYINKQTEELALLARKRLLLGIIREEELSHLDMSAAGPWRVLLIRRGDGDDISLLNVPTGRIISEMLEDIEVFRVSFDDGRICFLLKLNGGLEDVYDRIEGCFASIQELLDIQLTGALGDEAGCLEDVFASYRAADKRLRFSSIIGMTGLIDRQEQLIKTERAYQYPYDLEWSLLQLVVGRKAGELAAWMERLTTRLKDSPETADITVRSLLMRALQRLMETGETGETYEARLRECERLMLKPEQPAYAAMEELLRGWIEREDAPDGLAGRYFNRLVEEALNYSMRNYADPELNLRTVASALYVSAPYLGRIFKRITGKTYANYLNEWRIEQARKRLFAEEVRINEIAAMVGFDNQPYFQVLFKKQIGLTPGEYRSRQSLRRSR